MPVIALTADVMRAKPAEHLALGFAGFLAKPFRIPDLQRLLDQAASGRRPAVEAA
ncbi:MAG: hypothetical protein Q8Q88_06525 [Phenylobacterium sp.]|uniref:hypothetical protein n=1 Tax=Phenylobacterium sp. TaxID=1871053 RepID=UPI0027329088|nr:hypothetical protein [Phenylobacterium sp.]MDP3746689.1 hypothetical protein [Phenylobacterium sp.]